MGREIDELYVPIAIRGKNIDSRYFANNGDGTYKLTSAFIHNVIRDAMNFYKERIYQLDTNCDYHTEKLDEFKDTWTEKLNKDQMEFKYGDKIKEFEKRKRDWRAAHPEKCDVRSGGPDLGDIDELRFFAGYTPEILPGLKQSLSIYKALKEYDKEHGAEIKESIPQKPEVLLVKHEFKEEYQNLCKKWAEELGLPIETEPVGTITRTKYVINQLRNANMKAIPSDDTGFDEYVNGLINYITSSNKEEYKAKREEMQTLIDKDFVIEFNESSKELKATNSDIYTSSFGKEEVKSIDIWTKQTDSENPIKIITIVKENATDTNYKYKFNVVTNDNESLKYNRSIATKADLRKALETTIMLIENVNTFNKYIVDIQNTIDRL